MDRATQSTNCTTVCIDIKNFNTTPGATVQTWPCGRGSGLNEDWVVGAGSIMSMQTPPTCLTVVQPIGLGATLSTANCSSSDPGQALAFSAGASRIVHVPTGLCVDSAPPGFCLEPTHSNWTFCDSDAALDDRSADIVSRLSLADEILALTTGQPLLSSVGLPPYNWLEWAGSDPGII